MRTALLLDNALASCFRSQEVLLFVSSKFYSILTLVSSISRMIKVSKDYIYFLALLITTFVVPLSDIDSFTMSELWKYVSVSITVGYYFKVYGCLSAIVYALLTSKKSIVKLTLSASFVSGVIIILTLYWDGACFCHYRVINIFLLLYKGSDISPYGLNLVCLTYLLILAGDVELNPGPVYAIQDKRKCTAKKRFMADVYSNNSELLTMDISELCTKYDAAQRTVKLWLKGVNTTSLSPQVRNWVAQIHLTPKDLFMVHVKSDESVLTMSVANIATKYGVTQRTVQLWLKSVPFGSVNEAIVLSELSHDLNSDAITQLAKEHGVSERYINRCLTDQKRKSFVLSNDIDMTDKDISDKYGVRKAIVTSWKSEADNMWLAWYDVAEKGELHANPPSEPSRNDLYPHCICHECAVIIFECDVQWVDKDSVTTPYRATKFQGLSYSLCVAEKVVRNQPRVGSCRHCASRTNPEDLFDDFGDMPDCIKAVSGFGESRRLALGSLYCSTFKPSNYSYVHCSGKMGFSMNTAHLRGMAGMLKFGDPSEGDITTPYNKENVLQAFQWLRINNPLYTRFMAQLETLYGYFQTTHAGGLGNPVPLVSGNVELESGHQLNSGDLLSKEGMFVLADPDECLPRGKVDSNELNSNVGKQIPREPPSDASIKELCHSNKLSLYDPDLEHKLFPHLYPHARGGYATHKQQNARGDDAHDNNFVTLGKYIKMRLLHACARFRHDRLWPFFAYDWLMKTRIQAYNMKCSKPSDDKAVTMSKSFLMSELGHGEKTYDRVGQVIPPKLSGSKSYWCKQYLDLMAMCMKRGVPDYFITLTANDSWPGLKDMLEGSAAHFRPVETTLFLMQKYRKIKDLLWGPKGVFGSVTDHWQRIEFQNRGALHVHMLLWVDKDEDRSGKVVATMPRSEKDRALRAKVLKYQVHECREGRCYKKGKPKVCKYGFPFKKLDTDQLSESGIRFDYARHQLEDLRVVPYNKKLLEAWDGHINVQRVTQLGLVKYLVKYVSKIEPTFTTKVMEKVSEVEKYFTTRLIGAPEVATTLLSYHIAGGTSNVMFLDTNSPDKQTKVLKPLSHLRQLDGDSTDVFWDSFRDKYCARPASLEGVTYPDYLAEWEIFGTINKVPLKRQSRSLIDSKERVVAPRDHKVLPRWRFLTPLNGSEYYYQVLLLNVPFRSEADLISEPNASKTFKEECFLRNLIRQEEDALKSLEEASNRNFSLQYIQKLAKMLILNNIEAQEAVNDKLRNMGLGEVALDGDDDNLDDCENNRGRFWDDQPDDVEKSDLLSLLGTNSVSAVKDEKELSGRIKSLTPSQMHAFQQMTDVSKQQKLLFLTGPGGTGKSFLIHTVVAQLTYLQGKFVEVLATSGPAAYLLGGSTVHRFFRLDITMKSRLEFGTVDCSAVANTDVIIVDECSMMSARLLHTMHDLCCYATIDPAKRQLPFAGKSVFLCGDLFQLPAVESPQIYHSSLWNKFQMVQLTENCRQSEDPKYGEILNRLRTGDHTETDLTYLSGRVCGFGHDKRVECELDNTCTVLCSKHEHKDNINQQMLDSLPGETFTLKSNDVDNCGAPLNRGQLQALNCMRGSAPSVLTLKVGARVVVTRNLDVSQGIVNGTIGNVENITHDLVTVRRQKDNDLMCVQPIKHKIKLKGSNQIVVREQFPLILGWAITVHRVQGMTLSTKVFAYMDSSFFANGQAYVALSRVKAYNQLHLLSYDPVNAIKVSKTVRGLYGLKRLGDDIPHAADPKFTPIATGGVNTVDMLPDVATPECLQYLLNNLGDDQKLNDYMMLKSEDIGRILGTLQQINICNEVTRLPLLDGSEV